MNIKGFSFIVGTVLIVAISTFASIANGDKIQKTPDHVYICSFNVYVFGNIESKYTDYESSEIVGDDNDIPNRIKNIANVLAVGEFDLICIQEITVGERGNWVLSDLIRELQESHNLSYNYFISDAIGQGYGITEAIAFLYNSDVVVPQVITGGTSYHENLDINGDAREIVGTQWKAGDFDFTLYAVHLEWGDENGRDDGYQLISDILTSPTPSQFSYDPDIIVLGDFNRLGNGYESIKEMNYSPGKFLAPTITFFDPDFDNIEKVTTTSIQGKGVPGDNHQLLSTTVAGTAHAYDMILLSSDVAEEFPPSTNIAEYNVDFGIIYFDEPNEFGFQNGAEISDHYKVKTAYSDHRPLWIRFKTKSGNQDLMPEGPVTSISNVSYVGTQHGKKFHLQGCRTIKNKPHTESWTIRDDALKDRKPCGVCKP